MTRRRGRVQAVSRAGGCRGRGEGVATGPRPPHGGAAQRGAAGARAGTRGNASAAGAAPPRPRQRTSQRRPPGSAAAAAAPCEHRPSRLEPHTTTARTAAASAASRCELVQPCARADERARCARLAPPAPPRAPRPAPARQPAHYAPLRALGSARARSRERQRSSGGIPLPDATRRARAARRKKSRKGRTSRTCPGWWRSRTRPSRSRPGTRR